MDALDIVLYVPGMPFNGETIPAGRSLGGSESAGYYLARELARRGHRVTVFSAIDTAQAGRWEGVTYRPIGAPGEATPAGADFEAYVAATPCDVIIGQRLPGLFHRPTAAKVHLWWSHDLALRRYLPALNRQLWNLNAVLCVSAFHREQLAGVYGVAPERIAVVPNGVDAALFPPPPGPDAKRRGKVLVYSSRPERGLVHLVGGDGAPGIMERLAAVDPAITLKVCGYDNTAPELAGHYAALRERCRALPNVEWLGALSKAALAGLMAQAWLHVYPTTFEEVSCITAMEAQTAGTPLVTSPVAALPETLRDGGVHWVPLAEGAVQRDAFAEAIGALAGDPERYARLHDNALRKAPAYTWRAAADAVEGAIAEALGRQCGDAGRLARHLMRMSDIPALDALLAREDTARDAGRAPQPLLARTRAELETCYAFALDALRNEAHGDDPAHAERLARHYADYYEREAARGITYGPERLDGQPRFEAVARALAGLPAGARVLDYGCAHGHYTVHLARRFPHLRLLGVELVARNVATAREWTAAEGLGERVAFRCGTEAALEADEDFDAVLAAEVLEHVPWPGALADALAAHLAPGGRMVVTTPYGPWEALGYAAHHPWRAHLHHLERADLEALFGAHPDFRCEAVPAGPTPWGEALGSWLTTFGKPQRPSGAPDPARALRCQRPRETLSVCMVVAPRGETLERCLRAVAPIADEIVLGIDSGAADDAAALAVPREGHAWALAETYGGTAFALASPLATGFAAARNATVAHACGDWVLWIDDDEELLWPERLPKYLRDNGYDAYALAQHHFAVEPGGVIKTDYPCRLFRNRRGFSFYGVVHEHPERALNGGPGAVLLLPDVAICHNGYLTEDVRRQRFARNLPLMERDRAQHPERLLGRFLWIRDLAHLNRFEHEQGGAVSPAMRARAEEAVQLWRGLLAEGHTRLAVDALPYYSEATRLLAGPGIDFQASLGLHYLGLGDAAGQPLTVQGSFLDPADIEALTEALLKEKVDAVRGKYV